jgi:hypothetical protein
MVELGDVRRVWWLTETVHNVGYFAPEGRAATDALGCKGMWMGYFGMRAAPLGAVTAETVIATFVSFSPVMVRRAIPDVWAVATPEQYLNARLEANDRVSRRLWGSEIADDPDFAKAADLARQAVVAAECTGRPLAAANQALPLPDKAHLALWQSLTTLREHRGDGHVALLTAAGIDSVQALILSCGYGKYPRALMQPGRKWTDEQWQVGIDALAERGLVESDGNLTDLGRTFREDLERDTDRLASAPYEALGAAGTPRLADLLVPWAKRAMTEPNYPVTPPVGMPDPFTS